MTKSNLPISDLVEVCILSLLLLSTFRQDGTDLLSAYLLMAITIIRWITGELDVYFSKYLRCSRYFLAIMSLIKFIKFTIF